MSMRNFKTHNSNTNTFAFYCSLHSMSYLASKLHKTAVSLIIEVKDVIYFLLGNDKCVTLGNGADVEKSEITIVLGYFVAGYLTGYDATEY